MSGVLEHLFRPQKKAMELQTAKEILAEVFQVRPSEVDEMIRCRSEAGERGSNDGGLWPQEFWLGGESISGSPALPDIQPSLRWGSYSMVGPSFAILMSLLCLK